MKKIFLSIAVLFIFTLSKAQQIPNGNFEQWEYQDTTKSYEPVGWKTTNFGQYQDTAIYRYKPAKTGNYAMGVKTNFVAKTLVIQGSATFAFPFSGRPDNFVGFVKGNLALDDTFAIICQLTKNNKEVASTLYYLIQSQNNYIKFVNPFTYVESFNPDSCKILVLNLGGTLDDTLTDMAIDDLSFEYTVGLNSINNLSNMVNIYPNPANDILTIQSQVPFANAEVYNSIGSVVKLNSIDNKIDIHALVKGVYYLKLQNSYGETIGCKTFLKE